MPPCSIDIESFRCRKQGIYRRMNQFLWSKITIKMNEGTPGIHPSSLPNTGVTEFMQLCLAFYVGAGYPNLCPHVYAGSTLPSEPSPQCTWNICAAVTMPGKLNVYGASLWVLLFLSFLHCATRNRTQGLTHSRQALSYWLTSLILSRHSPTDLPPYVHCNLLWIIS